MPEQTASTKTHLVDLKSMTLGTRRKRQNVRTGCITCKARKVKCSEEKPRCRRCTDTGRKCDGYGVVVPPVRKLDQAKKWRMVTFEPAIATTKLISHDLTAKDRQWLQYFSCFIGPGLTGMTDEVFWSRTLPQISVTQPPVRHALIALALSCVHPEAAATPDFSLSLNSPELSTREYLHATSALRKTLERPQDSYGTEVILVCCLLFIALECLRGNEIQMLSHLSCGVNIVKSMSPKRKDKYSGFGILEKLEAIYGRLDGSSALFGRQAEMAIDFRALCDPLQNITFDSAFAAKAELDRLQFMTTAFVGLVRSGGIEEWLDDLSPPQVQQLLLQRLMQWQDTFSHLQMYGPTQGRCDSKQMRTFRLCYEATFVWLSSCLESNENCYDAFEDRFETIVEMADNIIPAEFEELNAAVKNPPSNSTAPRPASLSFCLDGVISPALYLTAIKCRQAEIRRRAIALLERNAKFRENLWDPKLDALVARRIVNIEEGTLRCPPVWVRNAAVSRTAEEPLKSTKVTFYATSSGDSDDWIIWEENLSL